MSDSNKALVVFQGKKIRRTWFNDEWWFSVVNIIGALTQTDRARKYWSDLKTKLIDEGFEVSEKIGQLKLMADDSKLRLTDCANTRKYVIGYCHLRKAIRKFRTSRIVAAKLTDKDYTIPDSFDKNSF